MKHTSWKLLFLISTTYFAEEQAAKLMAIVFCIYSQMEVRDKMVPLIVDYVMKILKWKVSLQTHNI